mmetsp:Transcript_9179/g.28421  ORF Transcript_9179/g.28421 Transcript_9179/m.28421 type:complete len:494 (-) Transcript_9179:83-1564(-)
MENERAFQSSRQTQGDEAFQSSRPRQREEGKMTSHNYAYAIILNIPTEMRSRELRVFFAEFVEAELVDCFHFQHRPQQWRTLAAPDRAPVDSVANTSADSVANNQLNCCLVRFIGVEARSAFRQRYDFARWPCRTSAPACAPATSTSASTSRIIRPRCIVRLLDEGTVSGPLLALPELHPPRGLSQGNVGTSWRRCLEAVERCELPAVVLARLGISDRLPLPRYGAVPPPASLTRGAVTVRTLLTDASRLRHRIRYRSSKPTKEEENEKEMEGWPTKEQQHQTDVELVSDAERWDRENVLEPRYYEERRFEKPLEVVWEKGGSGLVFYTDECFWSELEADERDADELESFTDLERAPVAALSPPRSSGDDARRALEATLDWPVGAFERHTRGIGSCLLRASGWEGGALQPGGAETPLAVEFRAPRVGLGANSTWTDSDRKHRSKRIRSERDRTDYVRIGTSFDSASSPPSSTARPHRQESRQPTPTFCSLGFE